MSFHSVYFVVNMVIMWARFQNRIWQVRSWSHDLNHMTRKPLPEGEVTSAEDEDVSVKKRREDLKTSREERTLERLFLLRLGWG